MLGFEVNLLKHLKEATGSAYPGTKITAPGYLTNLLEGKSSRGVKIVNEGWDGDEGHFREMKVKYRERGVESQTSTDDDCDIDVIPVYKEANVSLRFYRQVGIGIDDVTMARYNEEATKSVAIGKPATPVMNELLDAVLGQLNGFYQAVDGDLMGIQAVNFGKNARTGAIAPPTININKQGTVLDLSDGLGVILSDMVVNEFSGTPTIVGAGLFNNFHVQKMMLGMNQGGTDISKFPYRFFYDKKAITKWGANDIGVFEPGSVSLLHRNKYKGAFAGDRGVSKFFTFTPQLVDQFGNSLAPFTLDAQLKYYDCPTDITVNSYGGTRRFNRGFVLLLSAYYDQFNIPNDAYNSADALTGNNGTLWYTVSNDCDSCD